MSFLSSGFLDKILDESTPTLDDDHHLHRTLDESYNNMKYTDGIQRRHTRLEQQILNKLEQAEFLLEDMPDVDEEDNEVANDEIPSLKVFIPSMMEKAVFCGHVVTDLDSIAGAIGAAALYGGTPAAASELNAETKFALDRFGCPEPRRIEDIVAEDPGCKICLVDHQQTSQMNPCIQPKNVVGIIDHHALQNMTLVTDLPIYVDIRPWGSMSTIIGHTFLTRKKRPTKAIAGILLSAILSDTLNLQSPTTTEWDELIVTALAEIAEIDDIDELAVHQFRAKSKELIHLSAYSLVLGDQKIFSFNKSGGFHGEIGFGVIETTDDEVILERVDELVVEMVAAKKEQSLDVVFLAIVNIVKLHSKLVLCGPAEVSLAKRAYGHDATLSQAKTLMDLGKRVSRKKEFIPALASAIEGGWNHEVDVIRIADEDLGHLEIPSNDPYGQVQRRGSVLIGRHAQEFLVGAE
jgi:manganese-dependent inorganic pyrophosphatase